MADGSVREHEELLDTLDDSGYRIGTKSRAAVHRDGDWHQLVFVWSAPLGGDRERRFLLQLRSRAGDRYLGHIDALAGGHVAAGESPRDAAVRELAEEAGVTVRRDEIACLGSRKMENPTGVCKRVVQHYFVCTRPLRLDDLVPTDEAEQFVEARFDAIENLVSGRAQSTTAVVSDGTDVREPISIDRRYFEGYSPQIMESFTYSMRAIRVGRELLEEVPGDGPGSPPRYGAQPAADAIRIRDLLAEDAAAIHDAFATLGWRKPEGLLLRYTAEMERDSRRCWVALSGDEIAGYVTVVWRSGYEPFKREGIPEIVDLNVFPRFRRRGIATRLMKVAEAAILLRSRVAGIGVGLAPDYGAAQRLYAIRGYEPDGRGVSYRSHIVGPHEQVAVDDALILHLTKELREVDWSDY